MAENKSVISSEGKYLFIATGVLAELVSLPLLWRGSMGTLFSAGLASFVFLGGAALLFYFPKWLGSVDRASSMLLALLLPLSFFPLWGIQRLVMNTIYPKYANAPEKLIELLTGWSVAAGFFIGVVYGVMIMLVFPKRAKIYKMDKS